MERKSPCYFGALRLAGKRFFGSKSLFSAAQKAVCKWHLQLLVAMKF
jgi:hypothetical protein